MSFFHGAILRALPFVPRPLVRRIAGRYIAGETLDDLIRTAGELRPGSGADRHGGRPRPGPESKGER